MSSEDGSEAAAQDGLHFKIISFTDMHEWTLTKCACVCDLVCMCTSVQHARLSRKTNPGATEPHEDTQCSCVRQPS